MKQLDSIAKLINKFSKLPGVGAKTAQRYAYSVIDMTDEEAEEFIQAVRDVKTNVKYCSECGAFSESGVCGICSSREKKIITVVAYPKDVAVIEKAAALRCVYHVLHGTLSPLEGRGPDDIRLKQLFKRLDGVQEVILATNPDVEGEATAMYVAKMIKPFGIKVSRLAQGISMGSDIEYADEMTLSRALESRIIL